MNECKIITLDIKNIKINKQTNKVSSQARSMRNETSFYILRRFKKLVT